MFIKYQMPKHFLMEHLLLQDCLPTCQKAEEGEKVLGLKLVNRPFHPSDLILTSQSYRFFFPRTMNYLVSDFFFVLFVTRLPAVFGLVFKRSSLYSHFKTVCTLILI